MRQAERETPGFGSTGRGAALAIAVAALAASSLLGCGAAEVADPVATTRSDPGPGLTADPPAIGSADASATVAAPEAAAPATPSADATSAGDAAAGDAASTVAADAPGVPPAATDRPASPASLPALLDRPVAVGASVTHGFGARVFVEVDGIPETVPLDMGRAFAAGLAEPRLVPNHGSTFFFTRPLEVGPRLMDQALAEDPTLLVAVDYLFWFGYGHVGAPRGSDLARTRRLELLDAGLAQLERFDGPIIVGDFPDMTDAVGVMLAAAQVPTRETQAVLNDRVEAWAAERPQVTIVPLSTLLASLQAGERLGAPAGQALLKPDRLHPTGAGMLAIARAATAAVSGLEPSFGPSQRRTTHEGMLDQLVRLRRLEAAAAEGG